MGTARARRGWSRMRSPILAIAATLAACSPAPEPVANTSTTGSLGGTAPAANDAAIGAPSEAHDDPAADAAPPADGAPARFVGRWAANPGLCRDGAWRFEEKKLATAGEVSCGFESVTHVANGYDVKATCLAEGITSTEIIALRFPDGGNARMSVESKTFRPITLERCGS